MADPVDPLTTEIVRNALAVAVEEASIVVVRSSHSTFIQEGADACAALLDPDGELVAQSMATSLVHGASLRSSLPSLVEDVPLDSMVPGDVFAMNDPYRGGIHANDIVVFRPIFADDGTGGGRRVVLFAGTLIHVADVGGAVAGGLAALAADTFAEGLLLPPVRLYSAGQPVDDVARIVARNSRAPRQVMGDIQALVAGTSVATARVGSILAVHGVGTVERCIRDHLQGTEAAMRRELARLPEGTYHGRFTIDSDGGPDDGRSLDVVVAATLAGGEATLDFTGTSAQSRGAINASQSQTLSGVLFAVRCFVDHDLAMNEGCFRPVQVILPEGSVVNPRPPAACGGRVVTVAAVIEAIVEALSQAVPERAVASSGLVHVVTLAGRTGGGHGGAGAQPWLTMLYEFGGIGARRGSDGPDATGAFFLGGRSTISQVEPLEAQHPLRVRHLRLRPESGGAGRWTGGRGVELAVETLTPAVVTVRGDRMRLPPPGRDGGEPGTAGFHAVERRGGVREELAPKQTGVALDAGDVLVVATSGGGGLGPAHDRTLTAAGVESAESAP